MTAPRHLVRAPLRTSSQGPRVIHALLGPTNTGKTHRAIERMLEHHSGVLGLPLRLLAREVYDRVAAKVGRDAVALITGEEKRVGPRARYWICTVEAMPQDLDVDFVGVDEIQLAGHPERGHVFTDRLLHARGLRETFFMGAQTAEDVVRDLVPTAEHERRPRLSRLRHNGEKTLRTLPPRSAVVAFSMERVVAVAERIRQKRGGAAVVMGALSPRARNAQVAMYQAGEVDFLVATDAIGMGLNLDVSHVAFAEHTKFDGRKKRGLESAEVAQIAGRAGRHLADGTFGTLNPCPPLSDDVVRNVETHSFSSLRKVMWRSRDLDFDSIESLTRSLGARPFDGRLRLHDGADDQRALNGLSSSREVRRRVRRKEDVELLWEVCQIPDYQKLLFEAHVRLIETVFVQLVDHGYLREAWMEDQVGALEDTMGDVDTLLARMARIRTFTYLAHRDRWLPEAARWRERTRAAEDLLSDALHERLVARFVDRVGRRSYAKGGGDRDRADRSNAAHPFAALADLIEPSPEPEAPPTWRDLTELTAHEVELLENGDLAFRGMVMAKLVAGRTWTRPGVRFVVPCDDDKARVQALLLTVVQQSLERLAGGIAGDDASHALRGLLYALWAGLGATPRAAVEEQLELLRDDERSVLKALGLTVGQRFVFYRSHEDGGLVRAALVAAAEGRPRAHARGPGFRRRRDDDERILHLLGYAIAEDFAVRIDVAEGWIDRVAQDRVSPRLLSEVEQTLGCDRARSLAVLQALAGRPLLASKRRKRRRRRRAGPDRAPAPTPTGADH